MATRYRPPIGTTTLAVIHERERQTAFAVHNYRARIEQWMKAYAPWKDRTGDARRSLYADVREWHGPQGLNMNLGLGHGVPYGKYLEGSGSGRYAILKPAADLWVPRIARRIRDIWSAATPIDVTHEEFLP